MNVTTRITLPILSLLLTGVLLTACETPTKPERNSPLDEYANNYEGPFTGEERMKQLGIDLVSIPAGNFQMGYSSGGDNPGHTVELDTFEMGTTEITNLQYYTLIDHLGKHYPIEKKYYPVANITWEDAARFCNRLSELNKIEQCYNETTWECDFSKNGFRLPTEAEWEYACRAGTTTNYYTGESESDLDRAGWYLNNSGDVTHPVGQKEPNTWDLYDMYGNVLELCNDWYDNQYYSGSFLKNPIGPKTSSKTTEHVIRGGCYYLNSSFCNSSFRNKVTSGTESSSYGGIGFRVARGSFTLYYSISGSIGANDVTVTLSGDASSSQIVGNASNYKYSFTVAQGGTYTVTPSKTGYIFDPESITFNNVTSNQTQDFSMRSK